jgi:hypothetical protein
MARTGNKGSSAARFTGTRRGSSGPAKALQSPRRHRTAPTKAVYKRYNRSLKGRARTARYSKTEKCRAAYARYQCTPKSKARRKKYARKPHIMEKNRWAKRSFRRCQAIAATRI